MELIEIPILPTDTSAQAIAENEDGAKDQAGYAQFHAYVRPSAVIAVVPTQKTEHGIQLPGCHIHMPDSIIYCTESAAKTIWRLGF